MGDLPWNEGKYFTLPLKYLRYHLALFGTSGAGKTETAQRIAYGAKVGYKMQVIYLDAKGETKREEEQSQDNMVRFHTAMKMAGAQNIQLFPNTYLNGWYGTPTDLKNRLLSVLDTSESNFYGDVAANALDLALKAPTTPRSSSHFLANLRYERLKAIYQQHDPVQHQRVLNLDKEMLKQVEMRYQVFFTGMDGMLDGELDYTTADAVYLRVKGFTLRDQAARLGRFLTSDIMYYLAERKKVGQLTLVIIDEFNALKMGDEAGLLFEQMRSFGGCIVIASQGYAGLGEYGERILDSCSTYVLHACSDPYPITKRIGKRFFFETTYTEDAEGNVTKHTKPKYDWKIPVEVVLEQETGQAYWAYRHKYAHAQSAPLQLPAEQIQASIAEMERQTKHQQQLLQQKAIQKQVSTSNPATPQKTSKQATTRRPTTPAKPVPPTSKPKPLPLGSPANISPTPANTPPIPAPVNTPPAPQQHDDEPDEL